MLCFRFQVVVGWYKFRRNSSTIVSLRERAIHRHLKDVFPNVPASNFLLCLSVTLTEANAATHTFSHTFFSFSGRWACYTVTYQTFSYCKFTEDNPDRLASDSCSIEYKQRNVCNIVNNGLLFGSNLTGKNLYSIYKTESTGFVVKSLKVWFLRYRGTVAGMHTLVHTRMHTPMTWTGITNCEVNVSDYTGCPLLGLIFSIYYYILMTAVCNAVHVYRLPVFIWLLYSARDNCSFHLRHSQVMNKTYKYWLVIIRAG